MSGPSVGAHDAPGWYGKLATLGDFAHRRLPTDFIRIGDAWLSLVMSASREQLGERWLDLYLTAPVLRFAWAPGVVDANWWFGLLMPSCDNVGRYFPLLIAQRRARPPMDRIALDHVDAWFDHLAIAATQTLEERSSIEAFEQALHDAPPWPTPGSTLATAPSAEPNGVKYRLGPRATLSHWLHGMAIDELSARFKGCSIWWRQGSAEQGATASVLQGLPDRHAFAEMLSGA
jgi:type VI secretion system protein ImpM